MQSRILGTTMPVLEFALDPNESVISEAGELSWMTSSIQMTTHTQFGGGGGIFGVLKRVAGGGSLFMTEYRAIGAPGGVSFATKLPGHIVPIEVGAGHEYMIHRHGFLCATPQIQISVGFQQSLGAGIFGGDGFLLIFLLRKFSLHLGLHGRCPRPGAAAGHRGRFRLRRARLVVHFFFSRRAAARLANRGGGGISGMAGHDCDHGLAGLARSAGPPADARGYGWLAPLNVQSHLFNVSNSISLPPQGA